MKCQATFCVIFPIVCLHCLVKSVFKLFAYLKNLVMSTLNVSPSMTCNLFLPDHGLFLCFLSSTFSVAESHILAKPTVSALPFWDIFGDL